MAKKRGKSGRRDVNNIAKVQTLVLPQSNHIQYLNKLISLRNSDERRHRRERLLEIEDRRRFHPSTFAPMQVDERVVRRIKIGERKRPWPLISEHPYIYRGPHLRPIRIVPHNSVLASRREGHGPLRKVLSERIGFENPHLVMICVRRKQRREVIFAKRYAGGAGRKRTKFKSPVRNYYSDVDC